MCLRLLRLLWLLPVAYLAGCAMRQAPVSITGPTLHGVVHGGQQPVTQSTIQLYAVGNSGDGSIAYPLLNPAPQTDNNGNFNITSTYTCPSTSSLVYIVANGGNPGLAAGTNNSSIALVAALGDCSNLSGNTLIDIDEVTTVAAAYAFAPFASSASTIGSSTADAATLLADFSFASALADSSMGVSPGPGQVAGTTVPVNEINTLADLLANCINSPGGTSGDGSSCGNLFLQTAIRGAAPATDTFTAALHLADGPTLNTMPIFGLIGTSGPFQPVLASQPQDFSVGLTVTSGLLPSPSTLSFPSASVASTPATLPLTLTNNGQFPVTLSGFAIGGMNAADFS